jgi:hypothetical protein
MELTGVADERMIGGDVKSKRTKEEVDRGGSVQRADASEVERLVRRRAPWEDFAGNPIYEGDTIMHPSGQHGIVIFINAEKEPSDQWRVDYGVGGILRLCLQIGDKGQARVSV